MSEVATTNASLATAARASGGLLAQYFLYGLVQQFSIDRFGQKFPNPGPHGRKNVLAIRAGGDDQDGEMSIPFGEFGDERQNLIGFGVKIGNQNIGLELIHGLCNKRRIIHYGNDLYCLIALQIGSDVVGVIIFCVENNGTNR